MRRDSSDWSSSTMPIEALCTSCELLRAWLMIDERERVDHQAEQHVIVAKLRSSLVPSQKMLAMRSAHAPALLALLLAQEKQAQQRQHGNEDRQCDHRLRRGPRSRAPW